MNLNAYIAIQKECIKKEFLALRQKYQLPKQKTPYLRDWINLHIQLTVYEDLESAIRRGLIK